jgi:predicted phage terminase large subunit-like protein
MDRRLKTPPETNPMNASPAHPGGGRKAPCAGSLDLLAWARRFLPDHFARPPSRMHVWLAKQLDRMRTTRGMKVNVLAPRRGAKSTIATLAFPLQAALEGREPYIWIISDTRDQACAHLENLKAELIENSDLAGDYPQLAGRGPVWRSGSIVLANGVCIEAFGTGQRLRGRRRRQHRPSLIVCDDLQNDRNILSVLQRERARAWFYSTLMKAGTAGTNVVNLATALHRDALAMELLQCPGWISRLFQSIERWPDNMSLWQEWEMLYTNIAAPGYRETAHEFYLQRRQAMDAGASLLWPEEEDLYGLMCMRTESGHTSFEREKQNSPVSPELCEWPETYFHEGMWFESWPGNMAVKTLALDPSKGSDARRGDYSALVVLGVDKQGLLYVEADLARRPTPQIVADGVEFYRRHRPDVFGIEANQCQDLLGGEFEREFRRQGLLSARPWPLENHINKLVRIRRLGPFLSTHRLRFHSGSPGTRLLVEQLQQFPIADHDDGPDALEMALQLAIQVLEGRQARDHLGTRLVCCT